MTNESSVDVEGVEVDVCTHGRVKRVGQNVRTFRYWALESCSLPQDGEEKQCPPRWVDIGDILLEWASQESLIPSGRNSKEEAKEKPKKKAAGKVPAQRSSPITREQIPF